MTRITVIGLGNMGSALARTLVERGHTVTVWNRSPGKADDLVTAGASEAASLDAALAASPVAIVCVKNHQTATALLQPAAGGLSGKTVVDLSTGGVSEAEDLVALLERSGAAWQIGMINAYPSGIGKSETAILCAGPETVWSAYGDVIRALGGASAHVGTTAAAVPALFAAMFTARQGFMFGLLYGGAVCRKAGLPLQSFADQVPVTLGMAGNYAKVFMDRVPEERYDDAEATVAVYRAALEDVVASFEATGTTDALPKLMRDLTRRAMDEGREGMDLTVLVEMLAGDKPG